MFEGLKKLLSGGGTDASGVTPAHERESSLTHLSNLKPWEDRTLPSEERLQTYKDFVRERITEILSAVDRLGGDASKTLEIRDAPETRRWVAEAQWVQKVSPKDFCKEMERREVPKLLGKNFLGAEEWKAQGIDVGEPPPIPSSITKALLDSPCPLHPGQLIKETHILMLVPKTVNGEAYTALKLDELCAERKGSGDKLIYDEADWATAWKSQSWATLPQSQSEWVLLPKSDPDPKVSPDKHFRYKDIAAQQKVHEKHYPEYREVKALEVMTMALLYDLTHKERLLPDYLRCEEPNASGGRVCVGDFAAYGLEVHDGCDVNVQLNVGRALARKLKT